MDMSKTVMAAAGSPRRKIARILSLRSRAGASMLVGDIVSGAGRRRTPHTVALFASIDT
jgi:hypothetical protein